MTQTYFERIPTSMALTQLQQERRRLPIGALSRRLELNLTIASLAYREHQRGAMDEALEDAKEAAFGLLSARPAQPINLLTAWGVAAILQNDALAWRLAHISVASFTSDRSRQPPISLKKALRIERYASMLVELYAMLTAIAERQDGSAHERALLTALRSDKHDRRTYVWIETLYALLVAVRDDIGIDQAVEERGRRLTRLLARASHDERNALDFAGLGVLGVGRMIGRTWTASNPTLPLDLLHQSINDVVSRRSRAASPVAVHRGA